MIEDIIILFTFGPLQCWQYRNIIANRPLWVNKVLFYTSGTTRYIALRRWLEMARTGAYRYHYEQCLSQAFMWDATPEGMKYWHQLYLTINGK